MSEPNYMDRGDRSQLLASERLLRSDLKLVLMAIRGRYPTGKRVRREIVQRMRKGLRNENDEIAARVANVLLAADALNLRYHEAGKQQEPQLHLHAPAPQQHAEDSDAQRLRLVALSARLGIAGVAGESSAANASEDSRGTGET